MEIRSVSVGRPLAVDEQGIIGDLESGRQRVEIWFCDECHHEKAAANDLSRAVRKLRGL